MVGCQSPNPQPAKRNRSCIRLLAPLINIKTIVKTVIAMPSSIVWPVTPCCIKVDELLSEHCERLYPPTETLSMFLAQAMSADRSCQHIVNQATVQKAYATRRTDRQQHPYGWEPDNVSPWRWCLIWPNTWVNKWAVSYPVSGVGRDDTSKWSMAPRSRCRTPPLIKPLSFSSVGNNRAWDFLSVVLWALLVWPVVPCWMQLSGVLMVKVVMNKRCCAPCKIPFKAAMWWSVMHSLRPTFLLLPCKPEVSIF